MKTGIYLIKNIINNKIYIGSSYDINRRWANHLLLLKNNKHHSIYLQKAWNKYGGNNFKFEIIEECLLENLLDREQYYLNLYLKADEYKNKKSNYFIKNGYNICPLSLKGFTGKQSRKSILKQLKTRGFFKIYKVDINGNILKIYEMKSEIDDNIWSIYKSMNTLNILKNKNYGYICSSKYYEGFKPKILKIWNKGLKYSSDRGCKIYVYDIYGRFFKEFPTIKSTSEFFKTNSAVILKKLNKKNCSLIGNTTIIYYNFFKEKQNYNNMINVSNIGNIKVFTVFDEFVGYSSKKELCEILNVKTASLREVLKNRRRQIKGYILKHEDIV